MPSTGFYHDDARPAPRAGDSALERLSALLGADPEALLENIRTTARDWKKALALVEHLEHMRKVVLADAHETAREVARRAGEKMGRSGVTESELDNRARRSQEYRTHLQGLYEARLQAAEAEAEHYWHRNRRDLIEMQAAFLRTEAYASR